MAYTPIDKGGNFFNTKLYTGNAGTNNITGVGFKPDWLWLKKRNASANNFLFDVIRGVSKELNSNNTEAEASPANYLASFNSDGFTIGSDSDINGNNDTFASWNWKGAGANPAKTYVVKVVSDGGNKYRLDDFAANAVTLELSEGGTFTFDQSDSSNNGHPLRFSTTSNGTHAGGSIYTTGVTVSGTPGQAGAKTVIIVAASAPTLYYFCTVHSGMGGQANTPTTNSFTNLDGSIQSNISPNSTSKFSIVSYTGNGSNPRTVGHGLGVTPAMIIIKERSAAKSWYVYHKSLGNNTELYLNGTDAAPNSTSAWDTTSPTATVFTINNAGVNDSNDTYIAYCFADVQGFSKFGSYAGNNSSNGGFHYTGFKPAFIMIKRTDSAGDWRIYDDKRFRSGGPNNKLNYLEPNTTDAEADTDSGGAWDMLSNGFKFYTSDAAINGSGTYIYMAFAENPFTSSAGTPVTAR